MKNLRIHLCLLLLGSIYLSCIKDKVPPVVIPTAADTISKILDSVKGNYSVFVEKDSFNLGFYIVDTIGFDTIEVLKAGSDSILLLNYILSFGSNQDLGGSIFFFAFDDNSQYFGVSGAANFFLSNDSIEFIEGIGGFEWGTYLVYRGKKISP
ncbi:MAG TPA: hypothetical protein VE978_19120 [Chitinophagales bacterium]|nr:hypothetical protein [Chitinophagales bacterium]